MADQRAAEGALKQGFAAVESTKADIDSHLKRLEGDLSTIGSSWQGAASVQFSSLMAQWQENAAKVNQALQDLADNLRAPIRRWKPTSPRPRTRSLSCSAACERLD